MNAAMRTVTPSCRRSMSGRCSSTPGSPLIACTSRLPAANEAVGKYAVPPSPSTRQPSAPAASMNCFGLIRSVMRPSPHRQCRSDQPRRSHDVDRRGSFERGRQIGLWPTFDRAGDVVKETTSRGCSELLLPSGCPLRVFTDLLLAELGILDVEDDRVGVTVTEAHVRLQPREQLAVLREAPPLRHREVLLRAFARRGLDVVNVCLVRHTILHRV